MFRRVLDLLLVVCALAVTWLIARSDVGLSTGVLFLLPALILALPLLAGRYLGAERLSRMARDRSPRRSRPVTAIRMPLPWGFVLPRGGLLIASSLAVRPPPLVGSAH